MTTSNKTGIRRFAVLLGALALALAAFTGAAQAVKLKGSIQLTAGSTTAPYTGSYVRLYETASPSTFYTNPSSPAADQTYTPVSNGTEGLLLNSAEGLSNPAFDGGGNSLTNTLTTPTPFSTINFSVYLNKPKKGIGAKGAVIVVGGGKLATVPVTSADLTGWTVAWGGDAKYATPGSTAGLGAGGNLTGQLVWVNPKDKALGGTITLNWTAAITEPPFNAFTAEWQIVGTYKP
jgi:hypothetical protein